VLHNFHPLQYVNYHQSLLIALLLSLLISPFLWFISEGSFIWVLSCTTLWTISIFLVYYPFVEYVLPLLITRMSTFMLGSMLAFVTLALNSALLLNFLNVEDVEYIVNESIFTTSFEVFGYMILGYIAVAGILLTQLNTNHLLLKRRIHIFYKLLSSKLAHFKIHYYYLELFLLFGLPLMLIFYSGVTYSTRIAFAVISILIGIALFFHKLTHLQLLKQRLITSALTLSGIVVINTGLIYLIGGDNIPAYHLDARMNQTKVLRNESAQSMHYPMFELASTGTSTETFIYKIIASIPSIHLHLGYQVDTVSNENIKIQIKSTETHYTLYNQFNQELTTLEK